jgi:hypothetical protein
VFFRLMLGDLNIIMDGLTELEDKGVQTIDCRRAQFSAQEPILRLRMICQSWKVMFQAEYSSGSPLRMLVDLKASVEHALGRGKSAPDAKAKLAAASKLMAPAKPVMATPADGGKITSAPAKPPLAAKAAAASASGSPVSKNPTTPAKPALSNSAAPEFEVSGTSGWDPESDPSKK